MARVGTGISLGAAAALISSCLATSMVPARPAPAGVAAQAKVKPAPRRTAARRVATVPGATGSRVNDLAGEADDPDAIVAIPGLADGEVSGDLVDESGLEGDAADPAGVNVLPSSPPGGAGVLATAHDFFRLPDGRLVYFGDSIGMGQKGTPIEVQVTGVALFPADLSLAQGQTFGLSAMVSMSNGDQVGQVSWSSTDASVAKVSATGQVSAVRVGVARIIARSQFDPAKSASCEVRVGAKTLKLRDGRTLILY